MNTIRQQNERYAQITLKTEKLEKVCFDTAENERAKLKSASSNRINKSPTSRLHSTTVNFIIKYIARKTK